MYLLDIIVDYPHRPVRPVKPVVPPDTAKVPAEVPDTVVLSYTAVTSFIYLIFPYLIANVC